MFVHSTVRRAVIVSYAAELTRRHLQLRAAPELLQPDEWRSLVLAGGRYTRATLLNASSVALSARALRT